MAVLFSSDFWFVISSKFFLCLFVQWVSTISSYFRLPVRLILVQWVFGISSDFVRVAVFSVISSDFGWVASSLRLVQWVFALCDYCFSVLFACLVAEKQLGKKGKVEKKFKKWKKNVLVFLYDFRWIKNLKNDYFNKVEENLDELAILPKILDKQKALN
jgi:hypothetical protein